MVSDPIGKTSTISRAITAESQRAKEGDRFNLGGQSGTIEKQPVTPGDTLSSLVQAANPGATPEQHEALMAKAREANAFPTDAILGPRSSVLIPTLDVLPAAPVVLPRVAVLPADTGYQMGPTREEQVRRQKDQDYAAGLPRPKQPFNRPPDPQASSEGLASLQAKLQGLEARRQTAGAAAGVDAAQAPRTGRQPVEPLSAEAGAAQVSAHFAALPAAERGRASAEMLGKGTLTAEQITGYVAGAEGGKTNPDLALARAATLLESSKEPALEKAVIQALDKLMPEKGADPDAVQAFEQRMQGLFQSDHVSEEGKTRLVEALRESSNPTVRCAAMLEYSKRLQSMSDLLGRLRSSDFEAVLNQASRHPEPQKVHQFVAEQKAKLEFLEKMVPAGQAALGKALAGPADWKADPKADPNEPQTALGQLAKYLEDNHIEDQRTQAQGVMRALFDPSGGLPSGAAIDTFATLTQRARDADNFKDGDALGFFLQGGVQACGVAKTKEEQEQAKLMASAIQVAVAAGLGWGGVATVQGLGLDKVLNRAMEQGFRTGFSRLGQENLNSLLSGVGKGASSSEDQWKLFRDYVHRQLRASSIAQVGLSKGVLRAGGTYPNH